MDRAEMNTDFYVNRVAEVASALGLGKLDPQIAACRARGDASKKIDVAMLGRFKAGKSSFLNHLVGRPVLPIGVLPLTAVVTRLRPANEEKAEVTFLNGTKRVISVGEISSYVGENLNPNNEKQVESVIVDLPELTRLSPLEFVDTPGLGSAFSHNTEAALNWLPNVGAALVAISADAPLSERDINLVEELRRYTPKIVLLLTKADLLSEPQRDEVMAFVKGQMSRIWQEQYPVFFYSVKPGFEFLKGRLERELLLPLIQDRDVAAEQIKRHKTLSLIDQALNYLRVAHAAAAQTDTARGVLAAKLGEEREQFDLFRAELGVLAHQFSSSALESSLTRLRPVAQMLHQKLAAEAEARFPTWRVRLPRLLSTWRGWLESFLRRELETVSISQKDMFCEPLYRTREHLLRMLIAFHDRLAAHVRAALGVTLAQPEFSLAFDEPSAPPVDVGYGFDVSLDLLGYFVPMTIFRPLIDRVLKRRSHWELEKNLSRLAAAWQSRIAKVITSLVHRAEQEALDEIVMLETMLSRTTSHAGTLEETIREFEQFARELREDRDHHSHLATSLQQM
ncbi:MAG: dynamin family protein [Verrucomicrobiae bacterium]|nr:dynamin family protein [Verrucomicrobiae bacterium]